MPLGTFIAFSSKTEVQLSNFKLFFLVLFLLICILCNQPEIWAFMLCGEKQFLIPWITEVWGHNCNYNKINVRASYNEIAGLMLPAGLVFEITGMGHVCTLHYQTSWDVSYGDTPHIWFPQKSSQGSVFAFTGTNQTFSHHHVTDVFLAVVLQQSIEVEITIDKFWAECGWARQPCSLQANCCQWHFRIHNPFFFSFSSMGKQHCDAWGSVWDEPNNGPYFICRNCVACMLVGLIFRLLWWLSGKVIWFVCYSSFSA